MTLAWTIAVGLGVATLLLPFHWQPVAGVDWLLMALAGVIFGTAHGLLIRAFMGAPASLLAPFTYVQIVAAVIFGVISLRRCAGPVDRGGHGAHRPCRHLCPPPAGDIALAAVHPSESGRSSSPGLPRRSSAMCG